jgi:RNA recognition motif-containing protein
MSVRLFVGNLSFALDDNELGVEFGVAGKVDRAEVVRDRFDGRSRGFGFVEMSDESGADAAVRDLNGKDVKGRPIRVEAATSSRPPSMRAHQSSQHQAQS